MARSPLWLCALVGASLDKAHTPGCTPCKLSSIPTRNSFSASAILLQIQKVCSCSFPENASLVDVGVSALNTADSVNWLRAEGLRNATVLGFEANPTHCAAARKYFDSFSPRARFECKAVSDHNGHMVMQGIEGAQGASLTNVNDIEGINRSQTMQSAMVAVTSLDHEILQDARITFLKTDTQGHELHVLKGARRLLQHGRIDWIHVELDPMGLRSRSSTTASMIFRHLADHGFGCVNARINTYRPHQQYRCLPCSYPWNRQMCESAESGAMPAWNATNKAWCKFTDAICGHQRVAELPETWEEQLLEGRGSVCHQKGFRKDLCIAPNP